MRVSYKPLNIYPRFDTRVLQDTQWPQGREASQGDGNGERKGLPWRPFRENKVKGRADMGSGSEVPPIGGVVRSK